MRLANKVVIVSGGGQSPGDTIGNGRASALLYAREGAQVFLVDKRVMGCCLCCAVHRLR